LIESINLYGISIDKFKRILKMLLAEFFLDNPYYFVHDIEFKIDESSEMRKSSIEENNTIFREFC
jgi:hypothetical protein